MKLWRSIQLRNNNLHLSMEESMYLSHELSILKIFLKSRSISSHELWNYYFSRYGTRFIKRYVVYRYYRNKDWIVHSGLLYACDFIIYHDGPGYNHSTAALYIANPTNCHDIKLFSNFNRFLSNVKKIFIKIDVDIPSDLILNTPDCLKKICIKQVISSSLDV